MRREIICLNCHKETTPKYRRNNKEDELFPRATVKVITGYALRKYNCDFCNKVIEPGDKCVARSIVKLIGVPYYPWEHSFIIKEK